MNLNIIGKLGTLARLKRATDIGGWVGSTVRVADYTQGRWSAQTTEAAQLAARAAQYPMILARLRARVESGHALRLYRAAGSRAKAHDKSLSVKARPLSPRENRAALKYLRDPVRGPGAKAAMFAERAGDIEEVIDHPVLDLMANPNPWSSGTEHEWLLRLYRLLWGNSYCHYAYDPEFRRGRGGTTFPTIMVPMAAQHTRPMPDPETFIRGYVYGRDGTIEAAFAADEVWHQKYEPSPWSPYLGMSPLHDILMECDAYAAALVADNAAWENGAKPSHVYMVPPETTPDQIDQFEAKLNGQHRGPRNFGRFYVAALTDVKALQFTPKEMEYLAGKHDHRKVMRNAYGIPESVTDMNDANLASSVTGHRQFAEMTIRPALCADAEFKTYAMLPAFDTEPGEMWFAYDNPVPQDEAALTTKVQVLTGSANWTIDEARAELGYEPLPDGAGAVPRFNGVPLDRVGVMQLPPGFGGVGGRDDDDDDDRTPDDPPTGEDDPNAEAEDDVAEPGTKAAGGAGDRAGGGGDGGCCGAGEVGDAGPVELKVSELTHREGVVTKDDDRLAEEEDLRRALRLWFDAIRPGLLAAMLSTDETELRRELGGYLRSAEVRRTFLEAVAEPTRTMFARGYDDGVAALGSARPSVMGVFDVHNEAAARFLDEYRFRLAGEVADTTVDRLVRAVRRGIEAGASLPDIQASITAEWPEASETRAANIAGTETARALNEGKAVAWEQSGVVVGEEILLSGNPCDLCIAIHARSRVSGLHESVFPLGSTLTVGGRTYRNDYRDIKRPPFHPGPCRCGTAAVLRPVEGEG